MKETIILKPGLQKDGITYIPEDEIKRLKAEHFENILYNGDNLGEKIGKVKELDVDNGKITFIANIEADKYLKEDSEIELVYAFKPICSKCEEDFMECDHSFDEAHIIAKDVDVRYATLVKKRKKRGLNPQKLH